MTYQIIKKNIKSIILRVDKNGVIKVSAPKHTSKENIQNFVAKHTQWIESKLQNLPKYAHNESIKYFDKSYILQISTDSKNRIVESQNLFGEDILEIYLKEISTQNIKKMIFSWYKTKSQNLIESIIESYKNAINREVSKITLREMTTKWGSCNYKSAKISLNISLFSKPKICFEYVLLHELVHLIHPNHGKGFYAMLESLMPNWREVKTMLNQS